MSTTKEKDGKDQKVPQPGVAVVPNTPRAALAAALAKALPTIKQVAAKHIDADRLLKITLLACTRSPLLLKCHPATIVQAMMQSSEMGLEIGGGFGHAYLVPFFNRNTHQYEAQLIVGYQGYIELVLRSGKVKDVRSIPVFKGDVFQYEEGTKPFIRHVPDLTASRNYDDIIAVYAVALLADGESMKIDVMSRAEIDTRRQRSKSKDNGPWVTDPVEMARKAPVRRMQKYLPKTRELAVAVALDERDEGIEHPDLGSFEGKMDVEAIPEEKMKATLADRVEHAVKGALPPQVPEAADPGDALERAQQDAELRQDAELDAFERAQEQD